VACTLNTAQKPARTRCRKGRQRAHGEALQRHGGGIFIQEFDVDGADHVVRDVVAHVQVLDLAELGQLLEDVLVEVLQARRYKFQGGYRLSGSGAVKLSAETVLCGECRPEAEKTSACVDPNETLETQLLLALHTMHIGSDVCDSSYRLGDGPQSAPGSRVG